jgi:hypothetical protein
MIGHSRRLAIVLILIAIIGPVIWSVLPGHDFVVSVTAFAIGVVTFFGIAEISRPASAQNVLKGDHLRTAIACSLITNYLFIVYFTTFVSTSQVTGGVTQEFVTSFSNVIGVTIAFYF